MPADRDGDSPGPRPGGPEPAPEELLDLGPDRWSQLLRQRWADRLGRVPRPVRLVAAAAVFAAIALLARPTSSSPARSAAPRPPASSTQVPQPPVHEPSPAAQDVATVVFLARQPGALTDFVRSDSAPGACRLVRPGASPQRQLAAAVHRALPGYRVRSIARILDQFTAMCALQLRAGNAHGTTLVVQVAVAGSGSTGAARNVTVAAPAPGRARVSVVSDRTSRGWTVTVGAVGPATELPPTAALLDLAGDRALLW